MNTPQKNSSIPSWVGLSEEDIGQIIAFYDSLTDEEWVAHDEYAYEREGYTDLIVPWELLPSIRTLVERAEDDRRIAAANDPAPKLEEPQEGNFPPGWNLERAQRVGCRNRGRNGRLDRGRGSRVAGANERQNLGAGSRRDYPGHRNAAGPARGGNGGH